MIIDVHLLVDNVIIPVSIVTVAFLGAVRRARIVKLGSLANHLDEFSAS
jgi:hypothetical protein